PHLLGLPHHVVPGHPGRAPRRPHAGRQHAKRRRLPRAVGAEEPEHFTLLHREGDVFHYGAAAERFLQPAHFNHACFTPNGTAGRPGPWPPRPIRPNTASPASASPDRGRASPRPAAPPPAASAAKGR